MDGGSTDETRAIAARHGATVVANPLRRAEPGVKLGLERARHEIRVVMAADNGLPRADWVRRVTGAFADPEVRAAYTHVVDAPGDSFTCRYINRLHADPFNWFVFGPAHTDPARFDEAYPVERDTGSYIVYDLRAGEPPLLAMAQAFAIRGPIPGVAGEEEDDIAPVLSLIDEGAKLAYVDVGVWHETVLGFGDFLRKYHRRTRAAMGSSASPQRARVARLSPAQRRRRRLWIPYSLSVVAPLFDALRGLARDRDPVWLLHPVACLALTGVIARGVVEATLGRGRERHARAGTGTAPDEEVDTVVFMSGPLDSGLSGGDTHALRLCAALARQGANRVRLVAPPSMRSNVPPPASDGFVEVSTPLDGRLSSMPAYFAAVTLRMLVALRRAPASRVSVASTRFFFDVVPCAARRRQGSRSVAYVYHLIGESDRPRGLRSAIAIALERLSLGFCAGPATWSSSTTPRRARRCSTGASRRRAW